MVMASCDNFDLPNPPGQTNPEPEAVFENSGLVLTPGETNVNLVAANEANQDVTVANISELINFPADYDLSIDMQIAGNDNFSNAVTIATTVVEDAVNVNPDIFNGAIQKAMTKEPGTYDVYARFVAYAQRENTRVRLGGLDATFCTEQLSVRTLDPQKVLEQTYYLVPCDENGVANLSAAIKMENTKGEGVSTYDNPEFAIKVDVADTQANGAGYRWMIAPQSVLTAGDKNALIGCIPSPASELAGKLTVGAEAGAIHLLGPVLVTINVENDAYQISYALEVLYPLSGATLSKPTTAMMLYTTNYINYTGVTAINQQWILAGQPDQKGSVIFKQDANSEPEVSEDGLTQTGLMTSDPEASKLRAPIKGNTLYWCDVNLITLSYSISAIQTLSVIGSGNGWDLATAAPLKPSKDLKVWTAEGVTVGDEFKINANGAWTIGFSGTSVPDATGKQVYNVDKQDGGANLQAVPGTYKVTVDFSTKPYTVTLE